MPVNPTFEQQNALVLAIKVSAKPLEVARSFMEQLASLLDLRELELWTPGEGPGPSVETSCFTRVVIDAGEVTATGLAKGIPKRLRLDLPGGKYLLGIPEGEPAFSDLSSLDPIFLKFAETLEVSLRMEELKAAEKELLFNERKQRQIIDTSLDAVILVNGNAEVEEWSTRAQQLFGYTSAEAVGKRWFHLVIPPEDRVIQEYHFERFRSLAYLPDNQYRPLDYFVIKKNGERFSAELNYSYIELSGNHHFVLYFRDSTGRKRVESDLEHARKEAEAARAAEEAFLARMSHEIRTPLNVVIGMSQLLAGKGMKEGSMEMLEVLSYASHNLLQIINEVLDISKIRAGKMQLRPGVLDLGKWLGMLEKSMTLLLAHRPVQFELELDPALPDLIFSDENKLNQILVNLLYNALKFTEKGHIRLLVQAGELGGREALSIIISDTGTGIDKEHLGLIFHEFAQPENTPTNSKTGTGLGLSIVKKLVTLLDGTIEVESEKNAGTNFYLTLPYDLPDHDDMLLLAQNQIQGLTPEQVETIGRSSILVVEDDPMNQQMLHNILSDFGCEYKVLGEPQAVLQHCEKIAYDLILMDLNLPGGNGLELSRGIRAEPGNPNFYTPIIALTASTGADESLHVQRAGMQDVVLKPYSLHSLQQTILKWLDKATAR